MLPALEAANPNLKALVYKNLSFTVSYGCSGGVDLPYQSTGVGYCDASSNHPDWFLTSPAGERLNSAAFAQAWMMDVGSPAYQANWLSNVLADARSGGWDGVFMDDTNTDMSWHLNGRTIAEYQTPAAWRAATRSMLATVGPALKSAGLLAVPNLSAPWAADYDAHTTWSDWLQFTSGAAQEYYSKWGADSSSWFAGSDWTYRQKFQTLTEQAGKIFIGITYAPKSDTRSMAWARANFLLFDEPASNSALMFELSDPEAQDPYAPGWTADVGTPVGARFRSARPGGATSAAARCSSTRPARRLPFRSSSRTCATTAPRRPRSRSARRAARSCTPRPARRLRPRRQRRHLLPRRPR
jgi:hypothetical protein